MHQRISGVQRYASEVTGRLQYRLALLRPQTRLTGIGGHLWEQTVLPNMVAARVLWSPCNSGPLAIKRQVITVHDLAFLDHPEWFSEPFAAWYEWLIPNLVRRVRRVITVSNFSKQRLLETTGCDPDQVVVIPNGVNLPESTQRPTELRVPFRHYLVALGTPGPRKNAHRLLEAWKIAQRRLPFDVGLVMAGEIGRSSVYKQIGSYGAVSRVYMAGYLSDDQLRELYTNAVALVYVTLYEGFGLPPLEAMACGTPVVTSNVTALPEVVGDAALLVDPHDVEAIADGIVRVVEDAQLRQVLRCKGLERAKRFQWDRTAALTWQVLQQELESGS